MVGGGVWLDAVLYLNYIQSFILESCLCLVVSVEALLVKSDRWREI